jgi:hypothetical protein
MRSLMRIGDSTSRCSSGVEHFLGKEEVVSSILINGSEIIGFLKNAGFVADG